MDRQKKPRTILLDAGPDLREQALAAGLNRCDAIFFTHNHVDHTFGLDEVRRFNVLMDEPIDIFANKRTMEHLQRVYKHIFDQYNNVNKSFVATLIPHEVQPMQPVQLHDMKLTPIPLLHGRLEILGYRIEPLQAFAQETDQDGSIFPLAYCTDVSAIPSESWSMLKGLSTLVLDALRFRHHPTHMTVDRAVEVAQRVGAKQTWFVHMAHAISHAEVDASLPEGIKLAYDGLTIGDQEKID